MVHFCFLLQCARYTALHWIFVNVCNLAGNLAGTAVGWVVVVVVVVVVVHTCSSL